MNSKEEFEISIADIFRYYIGWKDTDEELITCIKKDELEKFNRFLNIMNVKRNFKKGSDIKIFAKAKEYLNKKPKSSDVEVFFKCIVQSQITCRQK